MPTIFSFVFNSFPSQKTAPRPAAHRPPRREGASEDAKRRAPAKHRPRRVTGEVWPTARRRYILSARKGDPRAAHARPQRKRECYLSDNNGRSERPRTNRSSPRPPAGTQRSPRSPAGLEVPRTSARHGRPTRRREPDGPRRPSCLAEARSPKPEARSPKPEARSPKPEARTIIRTLFSAVKRGSMEKLIFFTRLLLTSSIQSLIANRQSPIASLPDCLTNIVT